MADKMATRQDAKTIGGKGEADNKLITYQEISDYGCRIIGSAQYENNQCVALKDLQAASSSISGSLTCTLMGEMRVFIVNISGGDVSYNYGPSGKWWDYYTPIPNNYIKAGSSITVNAECAHNGTSHQSEVLFTLSTGAIVDNKSYTYVEKISGSDLYEDNRIALEMYESNLGESGGAYTSATYRVHFDFTNTTYVDVVCNIRLSSETLLPS